MIKEPVPGIMAKPREDNLRHFDVVIIGPAGSPYESGHFQLELFLPSDYPLDPPKLRFTTPIYHPNIDRLGTPITDFPKNRSDLFGYFKGSVEPRAADQNRPSKCASIDERSESK